YDALGQGFTLLARPGADGRGLEQAARIRGVPLRILETSGPNGAALTLVRPDHYVTWAGDREPADCLALIDQVRGAGRDEGMISSRPAAGLRRERAPAIAIADAVALQPDLFVPG